MSYTKTDTLLNLKDISLNFGDKKVLRDINLEVKDIIRDVTTGQVLTLVGPSGIGKTQLLKIIAGLIRPSTGEVRVGIEQNLVTPGVVGMVLQTYPLFQHYSLLGNLKLVCKDISKIDEYLNEFDLWEHKKKYPKFLSGGQRQRTAIVQQLLCSEHFILLDEPFSGLDPKATEKLCKIINKVVNINEKNTVILSSHILEPSLAMSDTMIMLGNEYEDRSEAFEIPKRTKIEGATIVEIQDLAAQGLAWNPEIRTDSRFIQKVEEIRQKFQII